MAASSWKVPPAPPEELLQRLKSGYTLSTAQLQKLRAQRDEAFKLEIYDPAFARAAKQIRAQHQENERIEELKQAQQQKEQHLLLAAAQRQLRIQQKAEERQEREEQQRQNRQAVRRRQVEQTEEVREKQLYRQRRSMVRDAIRDALLAQSNDDAPGRQRVMFNDPCNLPLWTPCPGSYDLKPEQARSTSFDVHPPSKVVRKAEETPGPCAYDPKLPETVKYSFGTGPNRNALPAPRAPGPGEYSPVVSKAGRSLYSSVGGKISSCVTKTDTEEMMARARELPGPGEYNPQLEAGVSKSLAGRIPEVSDLKLKSSRAPGPCSYDPRRQGRIRGGSMGHVAPPMALPTVPGPSAYFTTNTVAQERELRRLKKQVVQMVKGRQGGGASSNPKLPSVQEGGRSGGRSGGRTFMTSRSQ